MLIVGGDLPEYGLSAASGKPGQVHLRVVARHQGVALAVLGRVIADGHLIEAGPVFFTTSWDNPIEIIYERIGCVPLLRTRLFVCRR